MDAAFAGLRGQVALLEQGDASSVELVSLALARASETQSSLNAFRVLRSEAALEEAALADARRAAGERAPLLGVPVAIKDDTDIEGETTPFGCQGEFAVKLADGEAVRRLRGAGAIVIGKTNTPEYGQWPITEGPAFGATRNPWAPGHTPGGSSGGSAAAVAAGIVPAALGSDGLGSIRVPSAWTNLVGIKPQRGRVSSWPDPDALNGLACIGPLARTVADAALLLDAAAGNHPGDVHQPAPPAASFLSAALEGPPRRLRIALSFRAPYAVVPTPLDPEVRDAVQVLAKVLLRLGHRVSVADPAYGVLGIGVLPRSLVGLRSWGLQAPDQARLDHRTRENMRTGALLGGPVLWGARKLEPLMARQVGSIFQRFDVVLTPTNAKPPPPVGAIDGLSGWETDKLMLAACPYTWPWNVLGWPGVNVPAGFVRDGLPVGAQLLGPACSEGLLISLAAELESVLRWHDVRPPAGRSTSVGAPATRGKAA